MSSILMRTMTRKSILNFGYEDVRDLSVGMLIDIGKSYILIRAYYGLDKINFTEDVLNELGITKEFRITKPGKCSYKEACELTYKVIGKNMTMQKLKSDSVSKKETKNYKIARKKIYENNFTANNLRLKNHGH